MKKLLLVVFCCIFSLMAEAALPVNEETLTEAIAYGVSYQGEQNSAAMLQPWTIAETLATNPYRDQERVIVYTPYLLTALDAAGKAPDDATLSVAAAKELVSRYDGVLVVRAVINAPLLLATEDLEVQLVQSGVFVKPYHSEFLDGQYLAKTIAKPVVADELQQKLDRIADIDEKAAALQQQLQDLQKNKLKPADIDLAQQEKQTAAAPDAELQKICRLQYNFYFDQAEFNAALPYVLLIKDAYCGGREFAVDPALLK